MKRGDEMVNSIVERYSRVNPLTETEIKIIRSAMKMFLAEGYTNTTFRGIAEDSGVKLGVITYHFRSKDDLLFLLTEELMNCHTEIIEEILTLEGDVLFTYALEIAAQTAICETNKNVWDLYHAIYSHMITYEYIKSWAARKNYNLFRERLPHWTESDFREKEIVTSGIELAALKTFCDKNFILDRKITVVLDSMLTLYGATEEERQETISKVLEYDYKKIGCKILKYLEKCHNGSEANN